MYADRITKFGLKFEGRIDPALLEGALDYIEFNEECLSLEILCDHICEYDVEMTIDEYEELCRLVMDMGFDIEGPPFKHLKKLVR